ncbi:MAG: CHAT domain-containing protein [Acidobacteriota bacterium]
MPGVVVERIGKPSAASAAGLRAGDVLVSWERRPTTPGLDADGGTFDSFIDFSVVVAEQAPRGPILLQVLRGDEPLTLEVGWGPWSVVVRPVLSATLAERLTRARERIEDGDAETGLDGLKAAARIALDQGEPVMAVWLWTHVAAHRYAIGQTQRARRAMEQALALAPDPETELAIWTGRCSRALAADDQDAAFDALAQMEAVVARIPRAELRLAAIQHYRGRLLSRLGRLDEAQEQLTQALRLRQLVAPGSHTVALSWDQLGRVASQLGETEDAVDAFENSVAIREQYPTAISSVQASLYELARALDIRCELSEAFEIYQRALDHTLEDEPGSGLEAILRVHLADLADVRGDLAAANEHLGAAIRQEGVETPAPTPGLVQLVAGEIARRRGELGRATKHFERMLMVDDTDHLSRARALWGLGSLAWERGALDDAADHYRRALVSMRDETGAAAEKWRDAMRLDAGMLALERGELEEASRLFEDLLHASFRRGGATWHDASARWGLGRVALLRRQWDVAVQHLQKTVEHLRQVASGRLDLALAIADLAQAYEALGQQARATAHHLEALRGLEVELDRRRNVPLLYGFAYGDEPEIYRRAIALALKLGQPATAFHHLERFRAQRFLDRMVERDLAAVDVPEALARDRKRLGRRIDQARREVMLNPQSTSATDALRDARWRYDDVVELIRSSSPLQAKVRYPSPLDADAARRALDPGTVLVAFFVDREQTVAFVSKPDDSTLHVVPLVADASDLGRRVEAWTRQLAAAKRGSLTGSSTRAHRHGRELYQVLLEPLEEHLASAKRLLILPDGPLHNVAWGALVRPLTETSDLDWQYLVEWKPVHTALSATVYAELLGSRRSAADGTTLQLAAFGEPHHSAEPQASSDKRIRSALERRLVPGTWRPLEHSRSEVQQIAELFEPADVEIYLGDAATEEAVEAVGSRARILHLAAHGLLDQEMPLDSAIVLAGSTSDDGDRHNGLLQMWEVLDRLRLDADLVVLSACDSAVGESMAGEGLQSLSQAFQLVGARSVVASRWSVHDHATATLMVRFYRHLRAGRSKDEALRQAQLELIRDPVDGMQPGSLVDYSSPYYWAAFQVDGDWR